MPRTTNTNSSSLFRQPSWWVVTVAGTLVVVFAVAIVRELINWHQVRRQVQRLQNQVATAKAHQNQLQDLIDYLGSPTFQEREARLQLGLKKSGERVIVVPPSNDNLNDLSTDGTATGPDQSALSASRPSRWWSYFFAPRQPHTSPSTS